MKNLKKRICVCLAAVMLTGACGMYGFAAEKVYDGASVDGIGGWSGSAVMAADPVSGSTNKALKLTNGTQTWTFTNDMGDAMAYSGNILVSAKLYAESGKNLKFRIAGADIAVAGTGAWNTVSVLLNTETGKYEVYSDQMYLQDGAATAGALESVGFITEDTFYIDDVKAEQFVKNYSDERLETVFEDNFDNLADGNLFGQSSWISNSNTPDYASVSDSGAKSGKGIDFTLTESSKKGRLLHEFTAQSGNVVVSMNLKTPAENNGKLSIKLRQGPKDSGNAASYVFVQNSQIYASGNSFQNITTPGAWFNLKMIFDADTKTYNVFKDHKLVNPAPIGYDAIPDALGTIVFEMENAGTWYMDDLKIQKVLDAKEAYTTVFSEDFDHGFSIAQKDAETVSGGWKYGTRNTGNPANAAYMVTTPESAKASGGDNTASIENDSYVSGKILEVSAKTCGNTDQFGSDGAAHQSSSIRSEAIVVNLGNELQNNVKISADIYAANYFYKNTDASTRRDSLQISWGKNYNYNNGNNASGGFGTYISAQSGYVNINKGAGWVSGAQNTYTQNAWNHIEAVIDGTGKISLAVNGADTKLVGTQSETFHDLVIHVPYDRGGWWYLDNVKVEELENEIFHTDVNVGNRTTLVENNIDQMYNGETDDSNAFTISGVSYTKDGGKSYESAARDDAEYKLGIVELTKNRDAADARLFAARYVDGKLRDAFFADLDDSAAVGSVIKCSLLDQNIVCDASTDLRLYVWTKTELVPLTDVYASLETNRKKLFVASDSLAAPYSDEYYPQKGWGEVIGTYLNQSKIDVVNYAAGGRSSKSFYNESGRWNRIMSEANAGDFVLVSFAHNDSKTGDAYYTDPYGNANSESSYQYWLKKYADDCTAKGLHLIYVTPLPRFVWNTPKTKLAIDNLQPYVSAMREFANENGYMLVDLNRAATESINKNGYDASENMYMIFDADAYASDPYFADSIYHDGKAHNDTTHVTAKGAEKIAAAIAAGLNRFEVIRDYVK